MHTRRAFLTAAGLAAALLATPLFAQTPGQPFVAYDDGLANGWQNWSWAKVELAKPIAGAKPIRVEGDPWSALALHHDAFSTAGYSKLTFSINGGVNGGQQLSIKAMVDGKAVESAVAIQPKAKTWAQVEIPLKELGVEGKTIDGISWQGQANPYSAYYITRIQFE
ncbi:twin-arginine translocation signal domain-containing protein [Burkholderia sp. LMU1-1-1.1]|uniref:twin-arginine translocation signal domain-containing protein n=1 Tax=Burkholderia sp. LMU1-1-1.1 TaxID=3135266 RepID=UPI003436C9B5